MRSDKKSISISFQNLLPEEVEVMLVSFAESIINHNGTVYVSEGFDEGFTDA